jgi:hypothetical protein
MKERDGSAGDLRALRSASAALAQNYGRGWRAQGLPVMALFVRDCGEDATDEVPEVELRA